MPLSLRQGSTHNGTLCKHLASALLTFAALLRWLPTILVSNLLDPVIYRHAIHTRTSPAFKNGVSTAGCTHGRPEVSVQEGTIVFIGLWSIASETSWPMIQQLVLRSGPCLRHGVLPRFCKLKQRVTHETSLVVGFLNDRI